MTKNYPRPLQKESMLIQQNPFGGRGVVRTPQSGGAGEVPPLCGVSQRSPYSDSEALSASERDRPGKAAIMASSTLATGIISKPKSGKV